MELFTFHNLIAFLTLFFLELVLVVDNALVVILQCEGLPKDKRKRAVQIGLFQGALVRVILLMLLGYLSTLEAEIPVVSDLLEKLTGHQFTIQSFIYLIGGGVLIWMAGHHIRQEWKPASKEIRKTYSSLPRVLLQILGINLIFSLDSVLSAVGMVDNTIVAGTAVFLSAVVMVSMVGKLADFMAAYPDFKSLGLCFVFFIGGILVAEAFGHHVPKGIVYGCLGFGLFIQIVDSLRDRASEKAEVTERKEERKFAELSVKEFES